MSVTPPLLDTRSAEMDRSSDALLEILPSLGHPHTRRVVEIVLPLGVTVRSCITWQPRS